ncbi:hypothetical protein ACFV84_33245 [Kitasatospora sp. NPDC059811]|uniref:hypothetical protein n=1 Tax=Streptomycetaceae TaxID=2062 RepID=UPI001331AD47|nr:hypothetical protein [Streptomyces sp. MJM8645]
MGQARAMRAAGGIAVGWGVVLLGWAAYNCFGQVGFATYVKGIFYYGGTSVDAETGSLNYGLIYLVSGILLLRGRTWALGVAAGVALVEGYNRVRSLTGALLDKPQREWFTSTTEGGLKLATFALGVVVTAALILLLARLKWRERGAPEAAAASGGQLHWSLLQTIPAEPAPGPQPFQQQQPFQHQPAWPQQQQQQPPQPQPQAAWPPQPPFQQQPQPAWPQQPPAPQSQPAAWPQPAPAQPSQPVPYAQQPTQPAPHPSTLAQQPWPAAPPVTPGPVAPGPVAPPADRPPTDRPPQA